MPYKRDNKTNDQKLKEFCKEYTPSIMYIMPDKDLDGEEMYPHIEQYLNNMHDGDYIEWCDDIDECVKYITPRGKYNYELTLTFNGGFHIGGTMWDLQKHLSIIKYYVEECLENPIVEWYGVLEYHKKGRGALNRKPPHYHLLLSMENELEPFELQKTICAFWRHFGQCTFRPVESLSYWTRYMCKNNPSSNEYGALIKNIKDYKRPHLFRVD